MSKTRMGKRVASLLLSLVMMLSLLPTTVYAEGADDAATNDAVVEETIAPVNAEGVDAVDLQEAESSGDEVSGEDGTVKKDETSTAVAKIGDKEYETLDAAIGAVADSQTIVVNAGEYKLNGNLSYAGKAFTIEGAGVSFDMSAAVALHGAKITFNNVTFDYKTNGNYIGLQHADTLVYNNCTINGMVFLYAVNETFNNCTFNQTSADAYNVWTYGAQNVAFNGCTFNCAGKAVLVYNEGAIAKTDLTVTDTKFIASAPVEGKAAIEIDTSLMKDGTTITIDAATEAEGFAEGSNSKNSLWNDKVNETVADNKDITVIVNNETVYAPKATASAVAKVDNTEYATLQAAIGAAQDGDTVTLLKDIDLPATAVVKGKTITLDLNGKTISNSTDIWNESINAWSLISVRVNGDLTINDTAGGGTLKAKENDCYALDVQDKDTALTVNAGTYVGNISAIYAYDGKVTINGGHFSIQQKKDAGDPYRFTLNCYDSNYKADSAGFTVNGGTFENFDPRNNKAEGTGTSFVAEGVGVNYENGTFTATPDMAAQIVDAGGGSVAAYADHYDAIAAAKDGETVILLSDRKNFVTNTINANITIDLNGKTLSVGNNNPFFRTNGEVTIQNGTIESNSACVIVNAYNKLTLKNVKITGVTGDNGKNLVNVCSNAEVTIDKDTVLTASGSNGAAVFIGQDADAKYTLNVYGKVIRESKSFAISGNGYYKGTTTINIYDGAEVRSASVAIYHPQAGVINVNGGLVEGYCAIGIKSGSLNIKGGTVRGTADDHILDDSDSISGTIRYDGSAIVVDSRPDYKGDVKINISGDALVQSSYSTAIREIGKSAETTNVTALNVTGGKVLGASGKAAIQLHGVTADVTSISGGTYSTRPEDSWVVNGYRAIENTDGTYTVKEANIAIQVTSRIKDDGVTTVSTTTGGGMYCEGEEVTVTTSNVVGFEFLGWYEKDSYETPRSADLSYTFTASKNCTLVALYSPAENATLTVKVTASAFRITGSKWVQNNGGMYKLPVGSSVTVTYTDETYTFLYWVNGSDKIVSTSPEYTFTLGSNTELRACTSPKNTSNDNAMVVFKTAYDQVLTAKRYGNDEEIVFPMGPSKTGYKFIGWSMTQAEIRAAMAENDYIVVTPKYETLGSKYTVTVKYEGIETAEDTHTINVGDSILLTAAETVGEKTFSYWMIDDQIVSYLTTLTVFESKNVIVTAVYGVEANAEAKIRISDVSATQDGLYYLVTFTQAFALPEDATLVLTGFIRADDEESAANMNINRYSKIYKSSLTGNDGTYYQTIASKNADKTYYMMAFVQYKDAKGNLQTVYRECVKASYASLKGGN